MQIAIVFLIRLARPDRQERSGSCALRAGGLLLTLSPSADASGHRCEIYQTGLWFLLVLGHARPEPPLFGSEPLRKSFD